MKITFEANTFADALDQMLDALLTAGRLPLPTQVSVNVSESEILASALAKAPSDVEPSSPEGPGPEPEAAPAAPPSGAKKPQAPPKKPQDKPKNTKSAKAKPKDEVEEPSFLDAPAPNGADTEAEAATLTPAQLATIRAQTIEALQQAYSNGQQKEVFALLSKYGNGAKSFRELAVNDFVPISKAIAAGALS